MTLNKPRITALAVNPDDPAKRDLFLDGTFCISLPVELVIEQELEVGAPFGEEELDALTLAAQLIPAKEKAYQYLGYGDLSRKKLLEKLTHFGFPAHVAEAAGDLMEQQGFIDDARLAKRLATRFAEAKRWGPRRILPELLQRGIPSEEAKEAVGALETDFSESVQYHLASKYRSYDLSDRRQLQKVTQGLMRLGFDFDDIRSGINNYDD